MEAKTKPRLRTVELYGGEEPQDAILRGKEWKKDNPEAVIEDAEVFQRLTKFSFDGHIDFIAERGCGGPFYRLRIKYRMPSE